jgi:hypothetical protein
MLGLNFPFNDRGNVWKSLVDEFALLRMPLAYSIMFAGYEQVLHELAGTMPLGKHHVHSSTFSPLSGRPFFPFALPAVPPRNRTYILIPKEAF